MINQLETPKDYIDYCNLHYSSLIQKLIEDNHKFFMFEKTIEWCFWYDDNAAIVATCGRKDNIIRINSLSILMAIRGDDLRTIEYYLLHEIRHIFQHLVIADYLANKNVSVDECIIKLWIDESSHYVKAIDKNGNENPRYFEQDSELDAYAFSYAVMKYKYKDTATLYLPKVYSNDHFESIVNEWLEAFDNL